MVWHCGDRVFLLFVLGPVRTPVPVSCAYAYDSAHVCRPEPEHLSCPVLCSYSYTAVHALVNKGCVACSRSHSCASLVRLLSDYFNVCCGCSACFCSYSFKYFLPAAASSYCYCVEYCVCVRVVVLCPPAVLKINICYFIVCGTTLNIVVSFLL